MNKRKRLVSLMLAVLLLFASAPGLAFAAGDGLGEAIRYDEINTGDAAANDARPVDDPNEPPAGEETPPEGEEIPPEGEETPPADEADGVSLYLDTLLRCEGVTLSDSEASAPRYQLFRMAEPADGGAAVYLPVLTAEPDGGAEFAGLTEDGEYLLAELGIDEILSAHPGWSWSGDYEWSDGETGRFTDAAYTVYDRDGENPQTVRGIEFTVTARGIRDGKGDAVTITNTYSGGRSLLTTRSATCNLELHKTVTGNMGDRTKLFRFHITLKNEDGSAFTGNVEYVDGYGKTGTVSFVDGSATVSLRNGEVITLKSLPSGVHYTVAEDADDAAGYTVTYIVVMNTSANVGPPTDVSLINNATVFCTNARDVAVPTGVAFQETFFAAMLPILLLCAFALLRARRDDE